MSRSLHSQGLMSNINRGVNTLIAMTKIMAVVSISFMMLHVVATVIARWIFSYSLPGTMIFVSYYYMAIVAFLPLAYVERHGGHIDVEVIVNLLPSGFQKILSYIAKLISLVVVAAFAIRTFQVALGELELKTAMIQGSHTIAVWPTYFILPIGSALMVVVIAARLFARRDKNLIETLEE